MSASFIFLDSNDKLAVTAQPVMTKDLNNKPAPRLCLSLSSTETKALEIPVSEVFFKIK